MGTLTENAKVVIERRIAPKNENGEAIETAEQVFERVADNISQADANYGGDVTKAKDKFLRLLTSLDFLPNSPTLVNAGRELQQLSACFVLPVEDSLEGIFESVKQAALIHKTGGGTGFSFTRLRPINSRVDQTSGIASGPVSFMQVFDKATEVIKQGGTRRGANMGILRVDHPDIEQFIHIKDDLAKMTNFNISVAATDEFMLAVAEERDYNLRDPRTGEIVAQANARNIWNQIISSAHSTGDPGLIFIDRINSGKANPVTFRGPIESTNPCGEQPLYSWDSCNLGSINLANFVTGGDSPGVDFPRLAEITEDAVHFLDNVIDMNKWPNEHIKEVSMSIRRIGLGVMGWADMLIKLRIPYDSDEAVILASEVMKCISNAADKKSIQLGLSRGSFPDFAKSIYAETFPALRNSTRTTIAPTGTISIIAGCSSGIEPVFALEFERSHYLEKNDPNKRTVLTERHPEYDGWLNERTFNEQIPAWLKTSHEIEPAWHVLHQAAFQTYTDNAVSKTINFPKEATINDVESSYILAYTLGCMGITVYRDGSRSGQVLSTGTRENEDSKVGTSRVSSRYSGEGAQASGLEQQSGVVRRKLDDTRNAINHKFNVGDFEGYINTGLYADGGIGEIFIIGNKSGSTTRGYLDTIGSLFSLALQYGVPLDKITAKLSGTRFEPSGLTNDKDIPIATSVIDYIARWLERQFTAKEISGDTKHSNVSNKSLSGNYCPECDGGLVYGEGCETCLSCGFSKCG